MFTFYFYCFNLGFFKDRPGCGSLGHVPNPWAWHPTSVAMYVHIHVILGTEDLHPLCEVISPNFHALNGCDCMDWPQVTRDLGLGTQQASSNKLYHACIDVRGWSGKVVLRWPAVTAEIFTYLLRYLSMYRKVGGDGGDTCSLLQASTWHPMSCIAIAARQVDRVLSTSNP